MELLEAYKTNPCGVLSIPYWKSRHISIPENMRIVHHSDYVSADYPHYHDEPYFRLYHPLTNIQPAALDDISIITVSPDAIPLLVNVINQSYIDLSVTPAQLRSYTHTEVYCPDLWIAVVDRATSRIVGCGIADLDKELCEGIIEWIQVIPAYRKRGIGQLLVNELLHRMATKAHYATVSGKVHNPTSPEALYRKCGFTGNDIWHILTK